MSIFDISDETAKSAIDAAKALFSGNNSSVKTPISLLQEICMKCHMQPVYEVISAEGEIHEPTFVYKVTVGEIESIGKGTSKKRAKHNAAYAVLNEIKTRCMGKNDLLATQIDGLIKLINKPETNGDTSDTNDIKNNSNGFINEENLKNTNPVGELLEITQKYAIRPPTFEFGPEEGPPHNRQFVCHITFGVCKEIGHGRSKKDAKRQAAIKLLTKIRSLATKANKKPEEFTAEELTLNNVLYQHHTTANNKSDRRSNKTLVNSLQKFKVSEKPIINSIISKEFDFDEKELNEKLFYELAKEQNFNFIFTNLPNKSKLGKFQLFLELDLYPVFVIDGHGDTIEDAKYLAIFNALNYIKLSCERMS